ncbi:MAG: hypothetical protein ACKOFF_08840 [Acidimicrobiales bacterium]
MPVHRRSIDERGQATTEYALILLVAAVVALAAIGWATAGGGAGRIGGLFDAMIGQVLDRAGSQP